MPTCTFFSFNFEKIERMWIRHVPNPSLIKFSYTLLNFKGGA